MKKTLKPGERFNAFQTKKAKHKKSYSESDMGSMKGFDPTGGLGNKGYVKATAVPKQTIRTSVPLKNGLNKTVAPIKSTGGVKAFQGTKPAPNSTLAIKFKKKNSKKMKHKKNWIAGAIKKPGALHAELGVKKGNKIPVKTLAKAAKKGGKEGKRARLAETLKSLHHKHKKSSMKSGMKCKMCGKG